MPTLTIVVEGRADAALLRKVLPKEEASRLRFFAAQGRMSLATLSRNILVHEGAPVLVVMDADTLNLAVADETRGLTRAAIAQVAGNIPFGVFAFVPEIEAIFFEAPQALAALLARNLSENDVEQGLARPKQTLVKMLSEGNPIDPIADIVARIGDREAELLRRGFQLDSLLGMIREFPAKSAMAAHNPIVGWAERSESHRLEPQ